MPIASQVRSLAEDIEASYGARVAAVSDVIKETQQTLGSFHRAHKKMADDLKSSLSADNRDRVSEVGKMRAENVEELKDTAKELKEIAQKVVEFLSSSERERMKEFSGLIGEIKGVVETIEKETAKTLADFRGDHKEMAQALAASLSQETKERVRQVKKLLSDFAQEHQERAASLRHELSSFQRNLSKTVGELRADFAADYKEARTHWQNLAKVMAAKRAGKPVPTPRAEMGVPKAVKEEAEEAFETGEMKERVLAVIRAHPGGITLPEVGKALRVAYIRASKPIKELLMEMKVTKRDTEYFPA